LAVVKLDVSVWSTIGRSTVPMLAALSTTSPATRTVTPAAIEITPGPASR
jgi:hypothetical protein